MLKLSSVALTFALIFTSSVHNAHAQIYKYQGSDGKWHYSDKKPVSKQTKVESINYHSKTKKTLKPHLVLSHSDNGTDFIVHNPYFAPIQIFLSVGTHKLSKLIPENSQEAVYQSPTRIFSGEHRFYYVIGSPDSRHTQSHYLPPFKNFKPMKVTQSFKGRFSHNSQPSLYAIDIGMTVGTQISAARGGVVISTKDDYASAGVSSPFFIDKANVVRVLHDDGTYAVYAHLLLGSIRVKAGDKVKAGQILALSGNTGYSTGPHLHFVIRKNDKGRSKSLPFKLMQKGSPLKPVQGMWLLPTGH